MMKMSKRMLALCLVAVMVFTMLPMQVFATNGQPQTSVDTGNMSVQGTNGFGTLLSKEIQEAEAEDESAKYEAGYSVTDLVIEDGRAYVTYSSMEDALLLVALYTEDGMQMLTSTSARVSAEETEAELEFTDELPEYFMASAYLMDTYDCSPLCASFDTPMYTREMQELLKSTVDDYDEDRVLNLDDDDTTNFAVYAEETILIEAQPGVNDVILADSEENKYIFGNADEQIAGLQVGNVFVYPYAEGEILIVKVGSIETENDTVTILGDELEIEEAFAAVKIEGQDNTDNMVVDTSTVSEGVVYQGLVNTTDPRTISPMAQEGGVEATREATFKVDKTIAQKGGASVKISGSIAFSAKVEISYYVSTSKQYIDFRAEKQIKGAVKVTGKLEHEWPLCEASFHPVPGIDIGIEPTFKIEVSGEIEFSASVTSTVGFTYDTKKGFKGHDGKPVFDADIEAEVTIFIGLDLKPQVEIAEGWIAEFELEMPIGLEFKIKGTGHGLSTRKEDDLTWHECSNCLDIEPAFKAELKVKIQFIKCKWLKFEATVLSLTARLGHMYFSFDHLKGGGGICPYQTYRVTFQLKDGDDQPVQNTDILLYDGSVLGKTDGNGTAVVYMRDGGYTVSAQILDQKVERNFTVSDAGLITLKYDKKYNSESATGILGAVDSKEIYDYSGALQFPMMIFEGHTYTLFDGKAATWNDAQAYCESFGGHLATITSQEENDFLYNYMTSSGYQNAYFGLTDEETEGVWKWCTGESVEYTNWARSEPNNSGNKEHYAMFYINNNGSTWNDAQFGSVGNAILCEWDYSVHNVYLDDGLDHEYRFIDLSMTWHDAKAYCESLGGHLVTITSAQENAALVQKMRYITAAKNCYWIGLYHDDNNTWKWVTDEPFEYTRWAPNEPNDSDNRDERYVHLFGKVYTGGSGTKDIGQWNDASNDGAGYASSYYKLENFGFICEFDSKPESFQNEQASYENTSSTEDLQEIEIEAPVVNAVFPGEYGTDNTNSYTLKIASFKNLVPTQQYVILSMKSIEETALINTNNLLYIDQAEALQDGTLVFEYIQREPTDVSYVVACGASNKDLKDAEITFPEMTADGELQVVDPTVVYDGKTLTEGIDYTIVGTVDFTEAGEYTCYIRGIRNYTGLVECTYTVSGTASAGVTITAQPVSYVGAVNDELSFTVEATGNGLKYQWYFSTDGGTTWGKSGSPGNTTATLKPILRAYRNGYQFYCQITDAEGNQITTNVVSMTVKASEIVITRQPENVVNAKMNELFEFSVEATGEQLDYRWELSTDGGATWQDSWNGGYNTPNLSVRMAPNRDGNMYRCRITSGLKIVAYSDAVILDMQDPSVSLVSQSGNVFVTANKTATFTVEAEGMDLSYAWYRSNDKGATWIQTFLSGYNTNTLSFVGTAGRAAMYMCKITDGSGKAIWSSPVKLQILSAELKILTQPVSVTCADGETVTFAVEAQGDGLKYQWYSSADGESWTPSYLGGYNTDTFSFAVNTSRAAKMYKCVITDAADNTVQTDPVCVTIA